jgi:hypothetical protein
MAFGLECADVAETVTELTSGGNVGANSTSLGLRISPKDSQAGWETATYALWVFPPTSHILALAAAPHR